MAGGGVVGIVVKVSPLVCSITDVGFFLFFFLFKKNFFYSYALMVLHNNN